MKVLIVYYSFTQNNEKLATHLKRRLNCDIVKIETLRKRNGFSILFDLMFNRKPALKNAPCSLRGYDYLIFVAPIWAGKIAMPMKTFLVNERMNIKRYSFVTLCGGGNARQGAKIQSQLKEMTGKAPDKAEQLWVTKLLATRKCDTVKNVTRYRIEPEELEYFDQQILEVFEHSDLIEP